MNAPENETGASPIVFSSFTRSAFPEMLGSRIMRTVRPLIAGFVARALWDVAHAVYQSLSALLYPVAQPVSAASRHAAAILQSVMWAPFGESRDSAEAHRQSQPALADCADEVAVSRAAPGASLPAVQPGGDARPAPRGQSKRRQAGSTRAAFANT